MELIDLLVTLPPKISRFHRKSLLGYDPSGGPHRPGRAPRHLVGPLVGLPGACGGWRPGLQPGVLPAAKMG
jgi:hypothetical protein